MDVEVDQVCPSCGTDVHCQGTLRRVSGADAMQRIATRWSCPACDRTFEHEHPFDIDLMDRSGFHSWVGRIEDQPACIVVSDGGNDVHDTEA